MTQPERFGKYEILDTLGRGGFGTVYRVLNTDLDRVEALMVLHPQFLVDPAFIGCFRRAPRAAGLHLQPTHVDGTPQCESGAELCESFHQGEAKQ
jgi:serine/threonine protein kinase